MNHIKVLEAKKTLDKLLGKQRVALYKPIQIAEILYRVRRGELSINDVRHNLEAYRNPSKRWRDSVTRLLIDQVSTSSQKYQDNLFESNAMLPETIAVLAEENSRYQGVVERYIYQQFRERQRRILCLAELLDEVTIDKFSLDAFLVQFVRDKKIKRSIDKAYEIVVYALFNTLVKHLRIEVTLAADPSQIDLLRAFEEFARLVLGIDAQTPRSVLKRGYIVQVQQMLPIEGWICGQISVLLFKSSISRSRMNLLRISVMRLQQTEL